MPPVVFDLAIPVSEKLQTHALDCVATGIGKRFMDPVTNRTAFPFLICVRLILILLCMVSALLKSVTKMLCAFRLLLLHIPFIVTCAAM